MTNGSSWTSVSMPYIGGQRGDAWGAEAARHGGTGTQQLLGVDEAAASVMVAAMLGVDPGEPVVIRRRLILFDGSPVELVDSHYPTSIARGTRLAEARKVPGGAVAFLTGLGYPSRRVLEDITARLATEQERSELRLDAPSCVLLLARTLITDNDLPAEATVMTMAANGRRLRYELTP